MPQRDKEDGCNSAHSSPRKPPGDRGEWRGDNRRANHNIHVLLDTRGRSRSVTNKSRGPSDRADDEEMEVVEKVEVRVGRFEVTMVEWGTGIAAIA